MPLNTTALTTGCATKPVVMVKRGARLRALLFSISMIQSHVVRIKRYILNMSDNNGLTHAHQIYDKEGYQMSIFSNPFEWIEVAHSKIMSDILELDKIPRTTARTLDNAIRAASDNDSKRAAISSCIDNGRRQYTIAAAAISDEISTTITAAKQEPAAFGQQTIDAYCRILSDWDARIKKCTEDLALNICHDSVYYHVRRELFADMVNDQLDHEIIRSVIC